ncbi:MAG: lytic transglycosylase domain-containing protein, partial [Desulfobacteraceae bacterium]|nr:lytic transglycosylase domain-containing protein [Desulfobacteraceae bacterium]
MRVVIVCCSLFFVTTFCALAGDSTRYGNEFILPSLVKSIRFSKPLFFCGNEIPVHRQDIKERLEKEVLLALWDRPQVILWIKRASKYFPHIEKIIKQANLPDDLKYVAVIESGLRPHVSSYKGAVGYWQFLRSTGRMYGLKSNYNIDERRNLFKSTQSACKYFKELNRQFDDWFLTVAAYNMGANRLKKN